MLPLAFAVLLLLGFPITPVVPSSGSWPNWLCSQSCIRTA